MAGRRQGRLVVNHYKDMGFVTQTGWGDDGVHSGWGIGRIYFWRLY
jgi:hypothetical protein